MIKICLNQRVTKQWQDIGFQGEDPKTDFRGMGMLGLHNLMKVILVTNFSARLLIIISFTHLM